ncbi:MAG TPA: class I SAM-dependent methyltransferase [Candidatus Pelethocola excrementipullorum]|nr:class I SAM-dependent methyltransferase [Candidatus Pelethocola excrementipullorum]
MAELLKDIESYWTTRTEGYSEVNQKELEGMQKAAWLQVLLEQFPPGEKEELNILDIGTGPGFFPVILAQEGYRVTAVDYTENMLKKALENAGELGDRITFLRMDAQSLEFPNESFDVVISRNLTWNLEKPERAYEEWFRVLKTGGKMINFDANWYGYLYDQEKREAYEEDRENVKSNALDDHYLCTDIDKMEEIARQVPLSAARRPEWDISVLENSGFCHIAADQQIWQRVWSPEERLNYQSTPMFMVTGIKEGGYR